MGFGMCYTYCRHNVKKKEQREAMGSTPATSTTAPAKLRTAERRAAVVALRKQGGTYRQIAAQIGCSVSTAHTDVAQAMDRLATIAAEDALVIAQINLLRLDTMFASVWPAASKGDPGAIGMALKLMGEMDRYNGFDAWVRNSTRIEQTTNHAGAPPLREVVVRLQEEKNA